MGFHDIEFYGTQYQSISWKIRAVHLDLQTLISILHENSYDFDTYPWIKWLLEIHCFRHIQYMVESAKIMLILFIGIKCVDQAEWFKCIIGCPWWRFFEAHFENVPGSGLLYVRLKYGVLYWPTVSLLSQGVKKAWINKFDMW